MSKAEEGQVAAAAVNPVLTTAPHQWTTNMTASSLTAASGNSCLDEQIERLKRCEYLREGEVKALCLRAREILVDESNVQRVDAPVTVSSNKQTTTTQPTYFYDYHDYVVLLLHDTRHM
jgi:hypothetical protein